MTTLVLIASAWAAWRRRAIVAVAVAIAGDRKLHTLLDAHWPLIDVLQGNVVHNDVVSDLVADDVAVLLALLVCEVQFAKHRRIRHRRSHALHIRPACVQTRTWYCINRVGTAARADTQWRTLAPRTRWPQREAPTNVPTVPEGPYMRSDIQFRNVPTVWISVHHPLGYFRALFRTN